MAKVFQANFSVATEAKVNTNVLKANLSNLLSMGKAAMVVSFIFNPKTPTTPLEKYLFHKHPTNVYEGEMILLSKEDKFADGDVITSRSLETKMRNAIPCLTNRKSGNSYEIDLLDCKVKKL